MNPAPPLQSPAAAPKLYWDVSEAEAATISELERWIRDVCAYPQVDQFMRGKGAEILNTMLEQVFDSIRENKPLKAVLYHKTGSPQGIQLDGVQVDFPYWPKTSPMLIADIWTALLLIISAAANCVPSTSPSGEHPEDWFLELVISATLIMRTIAVASRRQPPTVIDILWTADRKFLLQSMSAGDLGEGVDQPVGATHILGSTPPGQGQYGRVTNELIRARRQLVADAFRRINKPEVADKYAKLEGAHPQREGYGKSAETLPFLSALLGGAEEGQRFFGISVKSDVLDRDPEIFTIIEEMRSEPSSRENGLRRLHSKLFCKACRRCCSIVDDAGWDYLQYASRDGRSFLQNTRGEEVTDS